MRITRRAALAALAAGVLAPTALARQDKPRTEGLFMCPCPRCKGKWLPNCANKNCGAAEKMRTQLHEFERQGKTDQQILELIVAEYGEPVVADPTQRVDEGSWLSMLLYGVPIATLLLGGMGIVAIAMRGSRATTPETPVPTTSDEDARRVAQALQELDR